MLDGYKEARRAAGEPPYWIGFLAVCSIPIAAFGLAVLLTLLGRIG